MTEASPRRVVEAEIRMPRLSEIKVPEMDLEPVRHAAEQVLLTGIGVGVLLARSIASAVKAANEAGAEAARDPGPITKALLSMVSSGRGVADQQVRVQVPVLPIDDYQNLAVEQILERLPRLTAEQLHVVRQYEVGNKARAEIIAAIDRQLVA